MRLCRVCQKQKPDRCHHCSACNQCVLRMDHHCPWVSNCIGFCNYKYFVCLLFHGSISCNLIALTSYRIVEAVLQRDDIPYGLQFFVVTSYLLSCIFGLSITSFLLYHLWLIGHQYTHIELKEKKRNESSVFRDGSPYDQGCLRNFQDILGPNILLWFVPINNHH